jgi:hypothetical protein
MLLVALSTGMLLYANRAPIASYMNLVKLAPAQDAVAFALVLANQVVHALQARHDVLQGQSASHAIRSAGMKRRNRPCGGAMIAGDHGNIPGRFAIGTGLQLRQQKTLDLGLRLGQLAHLNLDISWPGVHRFELLAMSRRPPSSASTLYV